MSSVTSEEIRVPAAHGTLHARRWRHADAAARAPIVLFHDSLGCVELWRDFPLRLAQATRRDVVAYDRLGFGQSDPHPGRLDAGFVHAEANDGFAALRTALDLDRFIAFGHSVGGGMAVGVAADYPDECSALITESAQAFLEDRTVEGIRAARTNFAQPGQLERLQKYHGAKAPWVLGAWIETWLAPDFAAWNLDPDLRRVRCPALVLHGDQDEFGSTQHPQRIAALCGGPSTLHVFAGCGHVPHRERADDVLARIVTWLDTALPHV